MGLPKGTIIAIIRGVEPEDVIDIQEALIEGGIDWVEVSLSDEEKGLQCIEKLHQHFGESIHLGVGTVTSVDQAERAIEAGANYIITPGWDKELIQGIKKLDAEIFPGVFTPGEVMQALNEGIEVCKLFPANTLGPGYLKNLKGPFPKVQMMAVGGVSLDNILEYFQAGYSSFGIGSDLVPRGATKNDKEAVTKKSRDYMNVLKSR